MPTGLLIMEKELARSLEILRNGGLILYPTDTVWGIGCDATNPEAVEKVYRLKKRAESKALICLVSDYEMLREHVTEIPSKLTEILENPERPTTIIYHHPQKIAPNLLAEDHSLGIRICREKFCNTLIKQFGNPIVSTSANVSGLPTPKSFDQISPEILKGVNYIVNLRHDEKNIEPSRIIQLEKDGSIKIIRA